MRGQMNKKNSFLAFFSTASEARMFQKQMAEARRKGAIKIKTLRKELQAVAAIPIPTWLTLPTQELKSSKVNRGRERSSHQN